MSIDALVKLSIKFREKQVQKAKQLVPSGQSYVIICVLHAHDNY